MNCEEFVLQSEEWMEGRRPAEARAHATACERCRAYVEDLDAIRLTAPQMAAADAAPPERLWQAIHTQAMKEGLIRYGCKEFADQSEEWLEGERTPEARAHAMACERCRTYVEDLDAIRLLAPQLTALDQEPPERLWRAIRAQMGKEGLIRHAGWTDRLAGWVRVSNRPLVAAAAALALAALTFTVTSRTTRRPPPSPTGRVWLSADETELTNVDQQLDSVERGAAVSMHSADPQVENTLQQNLMIVNRQIARCEKTLEEAPSDENTRDYLYDAYQQKADLLSMMAERSADPAE